MEKGRNFKVALGILIPLVLLIMLVGVVLPAAANPADKWYQCANGDNGEDPTCAGQGSTGWVTGKVGGNKATYTIGDFIAYRAHRTGLQPGMRYCAGAWWDVAKAELPAIDYLGSFDITVDQADPLLGTDVPPATVPTTVDIPTDPILLGNYYLGGAGNIFTGTLPFGNVGDPGAQGVFTLWGGTDMNPKGYALNDPPANPADAELTDGSQSIEICFTAVLTEVVLAWGGHIARPQDWNAPDRPTGSPYHMKTGTLAGFYTPPRTSENDLVEFDPLLCTDYDPCPTADHFTVGSQDLQLGISAPTAITLQNISTSDGSDGLVMALTGVGLIAAFSAAVMVYRRRNSQAT